LGGSGRPLTSGQVEPPAPKRQRTGLENGGINSSASDVVDLEDDPKDRSIRERSNTRSLKSEGGVSRPFKRRATPLAEYHSVENTLKPPGKQVLVKHRLMSDNGMTNYSRITSAKPPPVKDHISPDVFSLEDSTDPIYDPDADVVRKAKAAKPAPSFYEKSLSTTASKLPVSDGHTSHEEGENEVKKFRSYGGPQPNEPVSVSPDELPDSSTFLQRKAKKRRITRDSEGSMDELQSESKYFSTAEQRDQQYQKQAQILLERTKRKTAAPTGQTSDTDDEADEKRASIQPLNFSTVKKPQSATEIENARFVLKQVFPIRGSGLIAPKKEQWTLEHDTGPKNQKNGRLILRDAKGDVVVEIATSSIHRIEYDFSAMMTVFLHRNNDEESRCGALIYLELEDAASSSIFRDRLKKADRTVGLADKSRYAENGASHFERVFKLPRNQRLEPKPKAPHPNDADDLQFLQSKSEARHDSKWTEKRNVLVNGHAPLEGSKDQIGEASPAVKPKGLARNMQTDSTNNDGQQVERTGKPKTIQPQEFYHKPLRSGAERKIEPIRSSPRVSVRAIAPRPRERTPTPPLTWTELNPGWDKKWNGTVYYPPGERKGQVTVERDDVLRLNEQEFLNDNLVTFYLRYLEHTLQESRPEVAKRIYFHNSYFYTTLTKGAKRGINYQAVQRWTRTVDIISKDYIIVPICESLHWYVAIICNPSKLLASEAPDKIQLDTIKGDDEETIKSDVKTKEETESSLVGGEDTTDNRNTVLLRSSSSSETALEACKDTKTVDPGAQSPSPANKSMAFHPESRSEIKDSSAQKQTKEGEETTKPPWADSDLQNVVDSEASVPKCSVDEILTSLEEHPIANIKSDLDDLPTRKLAAARKAKKVSRAPVRDPNKPRIITFDSLGTAHSVTCTNLKEYLAAEIKDKKGVDIVPPKEIGMPARNIPTQGNTYDCGLYLLAYVTKFLESPDDFVSGIHQKREEIGWDPKASEIRNDVRDLLFQLQDTITPPKPAKNRSKPKKVSGDKQISLLPSLSARQSPGIPRLVKAAGLMETADELQDVKSSSTIEDVTIKQQSTATAASSKISRPEKEHANVQMGSKKAMENVLSKVTATILGNEAAEAGRVEAGKSESFPVEIGDSPESKRSRNESQLQHQTAAQNLTTDVLNSRLSSSQSPAESSSTLPKQRSAEPAEIRLVSMYPDPPETSGLIEPFAIGPKYLGFRNPESSSVANVENPTPQLKKRADRRHAGPSRSTSVHELDNDGGFNMTGPRLPELTAISHKTRESHDDEVDYAKLTQLCKNDSRSLQGLGLEASVSPSLPHGGDVMLLDVEEEAKEGDRSFDKEERQRRSIDRKKQGRYTPDQLNMGTRTTFLE
jgi:sentrin-specific protease 7